MIVDQKTEKIVATAFGKGSTHDFQLLKESHTPITLSVKALADTGYQGLARIHANTSTPAKKSKLHPLTQKQKASNRALSRQRMRVENVICKLKVFRVLSERYRHRRKRFALRFNLIAAIYNLELKKT